jgi:hypothetical protein
MKSEQTKQLDDSFYYVKYHLKELEKNLKKLEKWEERDKILKKLDRPTKDKTAGINRFMSGKYGV